MTPVDDYKALREDVGAVRVARDFVLARGADAVTFLDGQLSQDIKAMAPGTSSWSWLLQPQGKVVALVRVTRLGDEEIVLDTDGGWGPAVVERLERFKLRVKCEFEALAWQCLAIRGPRAADVATSGVNRLAVDWPGVPGFDVAAEGSAEVPDGVRECSLDAYEAVRIEAGFPRMGAELDEKTIPAEAGDELIRRTVSFTKGCYTGQELVARIDSRGGNVPKKLRGLVVDSHSPPPVGAAIRVDERDVGTLTSAAFSPGLGASVALGYVGRGVDPPAPARVVWDGGAAEARVENLPLVSSHA